MAFRIASGPRLLSQRIQDRGWCGFYLSGTERINNRNLKGRNLIGSQGLHGLKTGAAPGRNERCDGGCRSQN